MYVAYGLGRDVDVIGGYSVFGLGILELFPDGIVTQFSDKVYREIRDLVIGRELRAVEVNAASRDINIEEARLETIYTINRVFNTIMEDRVEQIRETAREDTIINISGSDTKQEKRIITVSEESRVCDIDEEIRSVQINKDGET